MSERIPHEISIGYLLDPLEPADDEDDEIIGSCEDCGGDVARAEARAIAGDLLCDQCAWRRTH